jgi:hypothetical protein
MAADMLGAPVRGQPEHDGGAGSRDGHGQGQRNAAPARAWHMIALVAGQHGELDGRHEPGQDVQAGDDGPGSERGLMKGDTVDPLTEEVHQYVAAAVGTDESQHDT